MHKSSFIPLILVTAIGVVFAFTQLPNTPEFPSIPTQPGTIGGALYTLFHPDGSASNTERLAGKSASGYLQNRDCSGEPINTVWVGVDATGKAICGSRTIQLALIGEFTEMGGSIQIMKKGSSTWTSIGTHDPLHDGDIIKTSATGTGTIAFAADASILRLDTSTTVELSLGSLGGQSVAQAILSDGRLWGRILTSTGVNLGGGGMVAGVRGTSVMVTKAGTAVSMAIVDSTAVGNGAATITNMNAGAGTQPVSMYVSSGTLLTYTSGSTATPTIAHPSRTTLLTTATNSAWIRDNTVADMEYLANTLSESTDLTMQTRLGNELDVTTPTTTSDIVAVTGISQNDAAEESIDDTDTSQDGGTDNQKRIIKAMAIVCQEQGKTYIPKKEKCFDGKLKATTEFVAGDYTLFGKSDKWKFTATPGSKNSITSEDFLSYTPSDGTYSKLAGKTITIELGSDISNEDKKHYIVDFGPVLQIYKKGTNYTCIMPGSTCVAGTVTESSDKKIITIKIPISFSNPTQMVIGNIYNPSNLLSHLKGPIGTTIKSIQIK